MKTPWALPLLAALAACAPMATHQIDSGQTRLDGGMALTLDGPWNEIVVPEWNAYLRGALDIGPEHIWTMEGLPIDRLLIYSAIKDGQLLRPARKGANAKSFVFRSSMQPDEIVALFEGMLTRDGSTFDLVRLEPVAFGGGKGFRFEYSMLRKGDGLALSGLGYAAIHHGELFAMVYSAPRLGFFPRHRQRVEVIARSVRIAPPATVPAQGAGAARQPEERPCLTAMECRALGISEPSTRRTR